MALPLPRGLVPSEVAFLAEMELVTVVPRQRLDSIELLSGPTPTLRPPHRAHIPLWLALLLKKQRRANIVPPPWMQATSLQHILHVETHERPAEFSDPPPQPTSLRGDARGNALSHLGNDIVALSPPFLPSCTAGGGSAGPGAAAVASYLGATPIPAASESHLPYHWLEVSELLLAHAGDDMAAGSGGSGGVGEVRRLLREIQEVRAAKLRASTGALEAGGEGLRLTGVGAMELSEQRGFVAGVADAVRRVGWSAEERRREEEEEEEADEAAGPAGVPGAGLRGRGIVGVDDDDDDEIMGF